MFEKSYIKAEKKEMETRLANHYNFIDHLRATAMFLVAWCHLAGNMNPEWPVLLFVQRLFNFPLHLIQNFGALAVSIFFLISGFLMCEPSSRTPKAPIGYFLYKTAGIMLPLWGETFVFLLFVKMINLIFGWQCYWTQFSAIDWLKSATLYNYMVGTSDIVNGPLWYLFPLLLAIVFESLYRFFSAKQSIRFVAFSVTTVALCFFVLHSVLPLCSNLIYIPIILWGYMINLRQKDMISGKQALAWGMACYMLMIVGFHRFANSYYQDTPYILSSVFAFFIFLTACLTNSKTKEPPKAVKFLSSISYSFYILHSLWGGIVISALFDRVPYGLALICGVGVSVAMAYLDYRYIEQPFKATLVRFAERWNARYE